METIWLPAGLIALAIVLIICGPTRLLELAAALGHSASALRARLRHRAPHERARAHPKPNRPNSTPRR